jgi:hypothetical protein
MIRRVVVTYEISFKEGALYTRRRIGLYLAVVNLALCGSTHEAWADDSFEDFFKSRREPAAGEGSAVKPERKGAADDVSDAKTIAPPVPSYAFEVGVRPGYHLWLAGKQAGQEVGKVFGNGPGLELTAGFRLGGIFKLYGAFSQVGTPVADQSPYANLNESSAYVRGFFGGAQFITSDSKVSAAFDIAIGISKLHQEGTDKSGNSASIDFSAFSPRAGVGAHVRPSRYLGISPMLSITLIPVSSYTSTITLNGKSVSSEGTSQNTSAHVMLGLGIEGVFALPLSKE